MNRRQAILTALTVAGTLGTTVHSEADEQAGRAGAIPGAVPIKIGQPMDLKVQSNSVHYKGQTFSLLSIGRGVFDVDANSHLTAKLSAGILEWARIDYWISVAVFDATGRLLGTASHKEAVKRRELGRTVMVMREIPLDFRISKAFANAAFIVVAISERDVPAPENRDNTRK